MKQWTDVDFTVTIAGADLSAATGVYVTVVQDGVEKIETTDVTVTGTNAVVGRLTQAQTGALSSSRPAVMFVNWLDAAGRKAASRVPVTVEENYPERELPDAEIQN